MHGLLNTKGFIEADADAVFDALRQRAALWDVPYEMSEDLAVFSVWSSEARLQKVERDVHITITAPERRLLLTLQESLAELFDEKKLAVKWDEVADGALAPGLSLMSVSAVQRRSPNFLRVCVEAEDAEDAERFGSGSLHFRLLLPPKGRQAVWPRINASGRTVWPEGEDAFHKPVYTTVAQQGNRLEFDVFRHDGSPTSAWAESNPIGQTVGIMGPGGGSCPPVTPLFLFGDETALPAIIRMLSLSARPVEAFVQASPEDLCELRNDPRVTRVDDLLQALEAFPQDSGGFIWLAGSAEAARRARIMLTERGLTKRDFAAAAYWS
ncbi:siderophore-interacting protein [Rhizobium sp. SSA_523]|uniref:siderophore-interacting protein n=1 Tax=Rhizobium sp. SSA_523 TaxID=2952477 RepID=UPI0020911512|nr:siderophore-interacting protein [Rhizobium sp. SSA_523]MCO5734222.1 siderophore-interacting protein [Rhizobium sp. SSA_523]WKC21499.1 siderophore-interacting protein [Rhizobium sp. SSA_523]